MELPEFILDRVTILIPLLLSLTVHEWAHAWTAWKLGDDTARMLGRVTLNPQAHVDLVGTLVLPLLGVPFGWAKPVPVNPNRFRTSISMPMGMMLTAAAGPISNLVLAAISFVLFRLMAISISGTPEEAFSPLEMAVQRLLYLLIVMNIVLACFNLLPIPPLDGSRIVEAFAPARLRPLWNQFTAISPVVLLLIILLPALMGFSLLSPLVNLIDAQLNGPRIVIER